MEENKVLSMEEKKKALETLKEAAKTANEMDKSAEEEATLSDSQFEAAVKDANEFVEGLKNEVSNLSEEELAKAQPQKAYVGETDLDTKKMNVVIDPATGEEKIVGPADQIREAVASSFSDIVDDINNGNIDLDNVGENEPLTEEDIHNEINDNSNEFDTTDIAATLKKNNISPQDITALLQIINDKQRGDKTSTYKSLPKPIKDLVDKYVVEGSAGMTMQQINTLKNSVANALLDDFETNIQLKKIKRDFAKDMEEIYTKSGKELSESSLEYIEERNKAYRENAKDIEDEDKREKLISILDQIDEARALTTLKEFAKKCKIKSIELEKPDKVLNTFMRKYENSNNNIYAINTARLTLARHLSGEDYTPNDINAFFIAFVKQTTNFKPSIATEHAYMYYVLYYCALLDGDKSDTFKNNVKEVIANLRERNPRLVA